LPVDRHVLRVSNRIGIAEGDDPEAVEDQLCSRLPRELWTLASDVQILHGRRICRPKPLCEQCSVREYCDYYRLVVTPDAHNNAKPVRASDVKTTKVTKSTKDTTMSRLDPARASRPAGVRRTPARRRGRR
jgi:hypothetical protein